MTKVLNKYHKYNAFVRSLYSYCICENTNDYHVQFNTWSLNNNIENYREEEY